MRKRDKLRKIQKEYKILCKKLKKLKENKPQMAWYANTSDQCVEYHRKEHEISTRIIIIKKIVRDNFGEQLV